VSVAAVAGSPLVNSVSVSGGGAATAGATDSTIVLIAGTGPTAASAVSVTPGSGGGAQQTFALQYADTNGATDLTAVWVWFTSSYNTVSSANTCIVFYARAANYLFLYNDAGTGGTAATLGVAGTLSNSQCSINAGAATVAASGTNLTVNLPVRFLAAYAGTKNVYMFASGSAVSGWQTMGNWTVPAVPALSVTSAHSGNFTQRQSETYTVTVSNLAGAIATSGLVTVTETLPSGLILVSMTGPGWTCPGNACTRSDGLNAGASYPAITVTVNVGATASSPQLNAVSVSGGGSATANATDSTVVQAAGATLSPVSVTPGSGLGVQQTFALEYADPLGAADLTAVWVWFTSNYNTVSAANTCIVDYARATNELFLYNDAGTSLSSAALGVAGTLSNSQCSINAGAATVTTSGMNLTWNLPVTFTTAYAGAKGIDMYAAGSGGANSGWQLMGSWDAPPTLGPSTISVTPGSGSGAQQTFALQYGDTLGAADLTSVWVWITGNYNTVSVANTCVANYARATNQIFLYNDAGTSGTSATLGVAGTLNNSQCSMNTAAATVTTSGTNLTWNLPVTFTAAYAGAKSTYMYAGGSSLNSGWQNMGSWTVAPPPTISSAPTSPLIPGAQFSVSTSQAVSWSVSPSTAGSFSPTSSAANQSVTFTVSNPIPNSLLTATITATASNGASGSATVNLLPPVTITPSSGISLAVGVTQPYSANIPVSWTVTPSTGGTFSATSTTAGQQTTFTMGNSGYAIVTITAADQRYSTNQASTTVAAPPVITPSTTNPQSPGSQLLSVSANQSVTWSVNPASAGSFSASTSSANVSVTFTVANPIPNSALTATITATGSGGSTAQLVVNLLPAVTITPASPGALASGATLQFSANIPVNWTVVTTNGGSATPAATAAGQATTFTKGTASGNVTLTATDQRYPSNSGSVAIPPGTVASATSVSPTSGEGSGVTFTFQFSDTGGASTLTTVSALIAASTSSMASSCEVTYNAAQNTLALLTDAGLQPSSTITPGSGTAQNSQCILTGSGSTASKSGNGLTLKLQLGFLAVYEGNKNVYGAAQDSTGSSSEWQLLGTWEVYTGLPAVYPMNPTNGQGAALSIVPATALSMNFVFADAAAVADMQLIEISFGSPATGSGGGPANGCAVLYNVGSGTMYLADNNGNWVSGSGTLSNSQCSINQGSSSVVPLSGFEAYPAALSITLSMSFSWSYLGLWPVYEMAENQAGASSGWYEAGSVTVNTPGSLTVDWVYVNNSGSGITLTAGQTATVQVQLTGNAPAEGAVVQLSANNPQVLQVPSTLTIPAGSSSGQVTVMALQPASGPVGVYVEASYGAVQQAPSPLILVQRLSVPTETITTSPPGLIVTVDGVNYTAPQNFAWTLGSGHTISVPSPQAGGTGMQYGWSSWSDIGSVSHSVTAPTSSTAPNVTYTASFNTQYYLTTAVSPAGAGTITPSTGWQSTTTQPVSIGATPTANSGYQFSSFSCTPSCSVSAGSLAMTGPETVTANFTGSSTTLSIGSLTISPSPLVSGGSATVTVTMNQSSVSALSVGLSISGSGSLAFTQMPSTITIPANQSFGSASFTVGTVTGLNSVTETVRASYGSSDTLSGTFTATPAPGSGNTVSREYIRLGGRVIAIENPPALVAAPTMSPAPGAYALGQTVTLTAAGATIYYTTNGSTPSSTNGTLYSGTKIQVSGTETINAIAYVSGSGSLVTVGTYAIGVAALEPLFKPFFGPQGPPRVLVADVGDPMLSIENEPGGYQ
jgi:hypothetical protein